MELIARAKHVQKNNSGKSPNVVPQLSLPKGGGAIRGMGEKFSANPVTGTGSLSVPIFASPGRSSFGPQLNLSYDSGSGNGPFGLGWSLSLPTITRKTDKGLPRYQDAYESDVFILSGAEDLVPVFKKDPKGNFVFDEEPQDEYIVRRYRPRIEGLFARIERWTNEKNNDVHWRSISKDNITTIYGGTERSRIVDPSDPFRIFSWLICESFDDKGNSIFYEYKVEDSDNVETSQVHEKNRSNPEKKDPARSANRYLKRILYGNRTPSRPKEDLSARSDWMFEIVFDYGELDPDSPGKEVRFWSVRKDPFSSYRAGFEVRTYRLCRQVLMFHHFPDKLETESYLVRSTDFSYKEDTTASFITKIVQSGYVLKKKNEGDENIDSLSSP